MSLRIDTTEWIAGALLIGETGLGVLGSAIPSTGDNGPGYAYNDLDLPDDAGKEICGRITTWPTAGTLTAFEDTSFTFTDAPDGAYTFQYQLYEDGVAVGSPATAELTIGGSNQEVSPGAAALTVTGYAPTVTTSAGQAIEPGAGALTLTGYAPTVTATAHQDVAPGVGALAITGYAPTVDQTGPVAVAPGVASLAVVGYAPTISQSGGAVSAFHAYRVPGLGLSYRVPLVSQARAARP